MIRFYTAFRYMSKKPMLYGFVEMKISLLEILARVIRDATRHVDYNVTEFVFWRYIWYPGKIDEKKQL